MVFTDTELEDLVMAVRFWVYDYEGSSSQEEIERMDRLLERLINEQGEEDMVEGTGDGLT